jgi:hypothetical protein
LRISFFAASSNRSGFLPGTRKSKVFLMRL